MQPVSASERPYSTIPLLARRAPPCPFHDLERNLERSHVSHDVSNDK